jgi:putative ABC transport system substrate-binding protein
MSASPSPSRRRRGLLLGMMLPASLSVRAQPAGKVYRIGYLSTGSATSVYVRPLEAFRQTLRERGWAEGQNIVIEQRYAEGLVDRLPALAEELVRLKVDVIAAAPTPAALAARNATQTIPIVGMGLSEPVAAGLVASLTRPGGNVTGVTYSHDTEIFGKQLELLKELLPKARLVAVLSNPGASPTLSLALGKIEAAARALDLRLQLLGARTPQEFDAAFADMARARADALLLTGDTLFFVHRLRLAELAAKSRLPAMSTQTQWVEGGGLIAYGPSMPDLWRSAALQVDRILRGARPADLPIVGPTTFELAINLKTAKALGLVMPRSLLARADAVIE